MTFLIIRVIGQVLLDMLIRIWRVWLLVLCSCTSYTVLLSQVLEVWPAPVNSPHEWNTQAAWRLARVLWFSMSLIVWLETCSTSGHGAISSCLCFGQLNKKVGSILVATWYSLYHIEDMSDSQSTLPRLWTAALECSSTFWGSDLICQKLCRTVIPLIV